MTNAKLEKAKELAYKIEKHKDYLKIIKKYEKGKYSDKDLKLGLLQFEAPLQSECLYYDLFIHNDKLKKDILNTIKIHCVALVQELEQELEAL